MPIPQNDSQAAGQVQQDAARSPEPVVRLVAGPGTGKSSTIEQRVGWLLAQGIPAAEIYAISFTRASADDLQERILTYCTGTGHANAAQIRVSTLHALALRVLRAAGLLERYPVDPLVLDQWELKNIFDAEFGVVSGIQSVTRRADIRRYNEAFWNTGQNYPPNYIPPTPPITQQENTRFDGFHRQRSNSYACVLPGEIVRQCVVEMQAGTLDPVALLGIRHLIVDEFQDLNPMDLDFIHGIAAGGVGLFAAGDDDQSIYSFRFAFPAGIQAIPNLYPVHGLHQLNECFRCMPEILAAATAVIEAFPSPGRIPKNSVSLYRHSVPPAPGVVHRWRFNNGLQEAIAVAESCRDLITSGIMPRDILILLSNRGVQERQLTDQLDALQLPYVSGSEDGFIENEPGRFVLSLLRIVCNPADYVAHRTLLGLLPGIGVGTCNRILERVIDLSLNYRNVFYRPLPNGGFAGRELGALNRARALVAPFQTWRSDDTFGARRPDLRAALDLHLGAAAATEWDTFSAALPDGMTLEELRSYVTADSDERRATIIEEALQRLGTPPQAGANLQPDQIRIMTMHGAKGLSGRVVFIPGLEDSVLPGARRIPYPGLVLEAARLLYVSVTRARACCFVSYSASRLVHGSVQRQVPSRFAAHLNGPFLARHTGLDAAELQAIVDSCNLI